MIVEPRDVNCVLEDETQMATKREIASQVLRGALAPAAAERMAGALEEAGALGRSPAQKRAHADYMRDYMAGARAGRARKHAAKAVDARPAGEDS